MTQTDQNSKQIHVNGAKRGKTHASKARLVWFGFSLVEKVARVLLTNRKFSERSKARPKQREITFYTRLKTAL